MSHRLFEKRLVASAKIPIDFVRDDAVIPNSLLPGGGSPGNPPVCSFLVVEVRGVRLRFKIECRLEFVYRNFLLVKSGGR